ncbi:MFS transporter [Mucilaginibacter sp. McL0603]|uniref:MFS transporter n=1 Tax=Mucilaginibacter sp. McL0603 TaxID=3415670 RepID=UPI003CE7BB7C
MQTINRTQLFRASCLALLVTSLSFGIRAGILNQIGSQFNLDKTDLASITATAFWGFPIAVVIGGMIVDVIGMKRLLVMAFLFHLTGILLTVFATGYWTLFISTLLIGIANGTVEAACNPLVTTLFPESKTTKLNHFHLWFPGGIFIGTLIVLLFTKLNLSWQIQVGVMLIPALIYGYLFSKLDFPVTERVSSGVSMGGMYKAIASPLFIFMFVCMCGTAITELYTEQWVPVLLKNIGNPILIVTATSGVMVLGRGLAKPVLHRFPPQVVLLMSTTIAAIGLYLLYSSIGNVFIDAIVFGIGVCYFWPTMLGFVNQNLPKTGALGLNLMGGAGMFAVSIYTIYMGKYYDSIVQQANGDSSFAGQKVLYVTLFIPIVLIIAFVGLVFYMRTKNKTQPLQQVAV